MAKLAFHCGPYDTLINFVHAELEIIDDDGDTLLEVFDDMAPDDLRALKLDSFVGVKCLRLIERAQSFLEMLDEHDRLEVAQHGVNTMMIWLNG